MALHLRQVLIPVSLPDVCEIAKGQIRALENLLTILMSSDDCRTVGVS